MTGANLQPWIYISLYQNVIWTAGKSFSVVMWPWFWKWKTLALPIWRLELITNKIKQNYPKQPDLAPLTASVELSKAMSYMCTLRVFLVKCDSINFILSVWITRGWTPGQSTIHVPDNGWNIQYSWWIQQVCFCDQYNSFHTIIRQGPFNPYCFSWALSLWILYRNKH